jgi:hypothetical protein
MSDDTNPTSSTVLTRPQPPRRRRWVKIAIAAAFAAQGAVLYAALSRTPETRVVTRVEHTKTTQVLTIPMAPQLVHLPVASPPTTAELRACPTPRTDAPRIQPPTLDEDVDGLHVSPTNAGWIAAWNDEHIFVSTDAGKTFRRTLDGIGTVRTVAFDCFGRVVTIRGEKLGIADAGRDSWRSIPGIQLADQGDAHGSWPARVALVSGGRDVIVVGSAAASLGEGNARVAVSRDLGESWSYRDLTSFVTSTEDVGGFQRADGTIVVGIEIPDCMSDALSWVEMRPDGTSNELMISMPGAQFEFYGDEVYTSYARRSLQTHADAEWTRFSDDDYSGTPIQAPYPVMVSNDSASRFVGSAPKLLPYVIEGSHHAMDPSGRLWSIVCGQLWIAGIRSSGRECTSHSDN